MPLDPHARLDAIAWRTILDRPQYMPSRQPRNFAAIPPCGGVEFSEAVDGFLGNFYSWSLIEQIEEVAIAQCPAAFDGTEDPVDQTFRVQTAYQNAVFLYVLEVWFISGISNLLIRRWGRAYIIILRRATFDSTANRSV